MVMPRHAAKRDHYKKRPPQQFFYDAISYEGDQCLIWPFSKCKNGYGQIYREGRLVMVSRWMCEVVNGPPPTDAHQAAHSCGNGRIGCITKSHLTWKTRKENEKDKRIHGTLLFGEKAPQSKITEKQASEIKKLKGIERQKDTAARYGITRSAVAGIQQGRSWRHI